MTLSLESRPEITNGQVFLELCTDERNPHVLLLWLTGKRYEKDTIS